MSLQQLYGSPLMVETTRNSVDFDTLFHRLSTVYAQITHTDSPAARRFDGLFTVEPPALCSHATPLPSPVSIQPVPRSGGDAHVPSVPLERGERSRTRGRSRRTRPGDRVPQNRSGSARRACRARGFARAHRSRRPLPPLPCAPPYFPPT